MGKKSDATQHPTVHRMAPSHHNKELSSPKGDAGVKNLPANAGDTGDASLMAGLERSPEGEMATHSILPGKSH